MEYVEKVLGIDTKAMEIRVALKNLSFSGRELKVDFATLLKDARLPATARYDGFHLVHGEEWKGLEVAVVFYTDFIM
jgi:hypothetical protein